MKHRVWPRAHAYGRAPGCACCLRSVTAITVAPSRRQCGTEQCTLLASLINSSLHLLRLQLPTCSLIGTWYMSYTITFLHFHLLRQRLCVRAMLNLSPGSHLAGFYIDTRSLTGFMLLCSWTRSLLLLYTSINIQYTKHEASASTSTACRMKAKESCELHADEEHRVLHNASNQSVCESQSGTQT